MISLIVAASDNDVIGHVNVIPWRLSRDLRNFKELTTGNTVVMGRKTFDSIISYLGHPLPHRKSVVLTRQADFVAPPDCRVASSWESAMKQTEGEEVFVGGGEAVYKEAEPYADRLLLTRVHAQIEGSVKLPITDFSRWELVHEEKWPKDEKNEYDATYQIYERPEKRA